jgi:hypothetical protein
VPLTPQRAPQVRPQSEQNTQDDEATVGAVRSFIKEIAGGPKIPA